MKFPIQFQVCSILDGVTSIISMSLLQRLLVLFTWNQGMGGGGRRKAQRQILMAGHTDFWRR